MDDRRKLEICFEKAREWYDEDTVFLGYIDPEIEKARISGIWVVQLRPTGDPYLLIPLPEEGPFHFPTGIDEILAAIPEGSRFVPQPIFLKSIRDADQ